MDVTAIEDKNLLIMKRWKPSMEELLLVYNLGMDESDIIFPENGSWIQIYSSSNSASKSEFERPGRDSGNIVSNNARIKFSPYSLSVYSKENR